MTLPASGAISFNAINVELGVAGTTTANINQATYRTLAGVPSGTIALSNFYGKSNRAAVSYTYSSNTTNASLNITSLSGYAAGTSDVTITINSGVYVYSTSTGTPGLTLSGGSSGDTVTVVNNGFILGKGGNGHGQTAGNAAQAGLVGGTALQLGFNTTVNNTNGSAYVAGGGGSGAQLGGTGGGGAGGGNGGFFNGKYGLFSTGAAGGGPGATGANGAGIPFGKGAINQGGGGGRILPGSGGAGGAAGGNNGSGGGSGGGGASNGGAGGAGGSGTSGGNSGVNAAGGGGGGWGASGGSCPGSGSGGASGGSGGKAVNLNGYSITWTSGNTTRVYGSVS
jgi:hypothetical protein